MSYSTSASSSSSLYKEHKNSLVWNEVVITTAIQSTTFEFTSYTQVANTILIIMNDFIQYNNNFQNNALAYVYIRNKILSYDSTYENSGSDFSKVKKMYEQLLVQKQTMFISYDLVNLFKIDPQIIKTEFNENFLTKDKEDIFKLQNSWNPKLLTDFFGGYKNFTLQEIKHWRSLRIGLIYPNLIKPSDYTLDTISKKDNNNRTDQLYMLEVTDSAWIYPTKLAQVLSNESSFSLKDLVLKNNSFEKEELLDTQEEEPKRKTKRKRTANKIIGMKYKKAKSETYCSDCKKPINVGEIYKLYTNYSTDKKFKFCCDKNGKRNC